MPGERLLRRQALLRLRPEHPVQPRHSLQRVLRAQPGRFGCYKEGEDDEECLEFHVGAQGLGIE